MESWTAENGILWLRGLLPEIVPHARILTYGYPSRTRGRGQLESESIHDLAKDLVSSIAAERRISGVRGAGSGKVQPVNARVSSD